MAIRVQSSPKKNFDGSSLHLLSHLSISGPPWYDSNEQQIAQILPQNNISFKVEPKHLDLQLSGQESTISAQAIGQSKHDVDAIGLTNSQCTSSESEHDESCGKDIGGQMKPVFLLNNSNNIVFSPSHSNYNHSMAFARGYPYADAYFGGLYPPYGQQEIAQMVGNAPTRILLPLDLAEDGPNIYVNAKQYRGILRRRQYRTKLEEKNKLVKSRKPYLHESRHLHALNRVRGSGGRFLSKKKLQQPAVNDPTFNSSSHCISDGICSDITSVSNST